MFQVQQSENKYFADKGNEVQVIKELPINYSAPTPICTHVEWILIRIYSYIFNIFGER